MPLLSYQQLKFARFGLTLLVLAIFVPGMLSSVITVVFQFQKMKLSTLQPGLTQNLYSLTAKNLSLRRNTIIYLVPLFLFKHFEKKYHTLKLHLLFFPLIEFVAPNFTST